MAEYIEREAVFDVLFGQFCASCDETEQALNAAIEEIKSIPAADVVPVVRCKHCRWAVFTPYGKAYGCRLLSTKPNYLFGITEDFFCAYGERMDMVTECNQVKDGDEE